MRFSPAGLNMSTLYHIGIVKAVVAMGTANFPELTDKVFIVNAPWAAVKGWNLISPMLPPVRKRDFSVCAFPMFVPSLPW